MKKILYADAKAFADETSGLLAASSELEMENNLALGLMRRIQNKEYEDAYMLAVKDGNGKAILAALTTPPYNLILSRGDKKALPALVEDIVQRKLSMPGVLGPADMADAFMAEWRPITDLKTEQGLGMTFYAVTDVRMPERTIPGAFRQATAEDAAWLTDWLARFAVDSNLSVHERQRNPEVTERKIREGLLFVWEKDGIPTAISGYAPITEHGVRIGSVYTPAAERGKGYATACVAHLSRHLLGSGKKWCSLFADMSNPISNGIYKKIGYEERCVYREYRFQS